MTEQQSSAVLEFDTSRPLCCGGGLSPIGSLPETGIVTIGRIE